MTTHASLIDLTQGGPVWIGTVEPRYRSRVAVDALSVSMTHMAPRVVIVRPLGPADFLVCTKATELRVLRIVFPAVPLWMVGSLAFVCDALAVFQFYFCVGSHSQLGESRLVSHGSEMRFSLIEFSDCYVLYGACLC